MKITVKSLAVCSAAVILACSSGCADTSWSFKTKDTTLSNGNYIYYTYTAYNEAQSKINEESSESSQASSSESSEIDVLSQKIEGKSAEEWIKDKALDSCIAQMTMNKLIKENKVKVDKEELSNYEDYYRQWYQYGADFYNEIGISEDTYLAASADYDVLSSSLFNTLYGKGGSKEVPENEIESYLTKNYTDYFYISYNLKTTDENGEKVDIDDETIDKVKTNFAKYADMINNKGKTTDDVVTQYKVDFETEEEPLTSSATVVLEDSDLSDDLKKIISNLKEKKATVTNLDDIYYIIYKGNIKDKVSELSEENSSLKNSVLHDMKDDDYKKYLDEEEKNLKYETNDACLSRYNVQRVIDIIKRFS